MEKSEKSIDPIDWKDWTQSFKEEASRLGFPICGVTDSLEPSRFSPFEEWLDRGYAGSMKYLFERKDAYRNARSILPECRTIVVLAMPYSKETAARGTGKATGRVARYASGSRDYHDVIRERLNRLSQWVQGSIPFAKCRGVVDTAPILERDLAQQAGLGWIGKNTLLLSKTHGSYFFLAAFLSNLPMAVDLPFQTDHCGSCRACLDACPTNAFPSPYVLDATRCISYLTIEHRGAIEDGQKGDLDDWIFGCDRCQEVCPWNRRPNPEVEPEIRATEEMSQLDLLEILRIDEPTFRKRFRKTPFFRTKWEGIVRNAILVVANRKLEEARADLERLAIGEGAPSVRDAAQWALSQWNQE